VASGGDARTTDFMIVKDLVPASGINTFTIMERPRGRRDHPVRCERRREGARDSYAARYGAGARRFIDEPMLLRAVRSAGED